MFWNWVGKLYVVNWIRFHLKLTGIFAEKDRRERIKNFDLAKLNFLFLF